MLHNFLQHLKAHLMRNTWWYLLAATLRQVKDALIRGMCDIIGVTSLTDQQRVQVQLPHRHGGMGLRSFSEDVMTAGAALAHAALAGGSDKAVPYRGAMGLEAHSSLAQLQEAWPTMEGLADSPDDAAESVSRMARPCGWQPRSGQSSMRTPTPAQLPSLYLSKQTQRKPLHKHCLLLLQTLPTYTAAPGRWRQHDSQHGLVQRSTRHSRSASVLACASVKISSQVKTETMRLSWADPWQPGAPTPSSAARCGTQWCLAVIS